MSKGGGGGGNSYDQAYNASMSTLANFTGGMGFNDYLRRYGYQLNPMYGGITNPMASYQIGTGANIVQSGQGFTQDAGPIPSGSFAPTGTGMVSNAINALGGTGAIPDWAGEVPGYQYPATTPTAGQQIAPGGMMAPQPTTGMGGQLPIAGTGGKQGANTAIGNIQGGNVQNMLTGMMQPQPDNSYFVKAVDRFGNPIISAIDLEDQANRLDYALQPQQADTARSMLEAQEALGLGRRRTIGNQTAAVNLQNATLAARLNETSNPALIAADQARARGEATANVQQAFNPAMLRTQLTRAGTGTQSGQFTDAMAKLAFERSKALAGGRYVAGRDIEKQAKEDQMQLLKAPVSALPTYS